MPREINIPEYRPPSSVTRHPWGEHPVVDYTPEEEAAWNSVAIKTTLKASLTGASTEYLRDVMRAAREDGDVEIVTAVLAECRAGDGWDDTDAEYNYLAAECREALQLINGEGDGQAS